MIENCLTGNDVNSSQMKWISVPVVQDKPLISALQLY